jgi:hypothetical protein
MPKARNALQSPILRRPAILRYASWAAVLPFSQGGSGYPPIAALTIDPQIDVMCHEPTYAVQQITAYSITSSATLSSVGGTVRPSDLAVW